MFVVRRWPAGCQLQKTRRDSVDNIRLAYQVRSCPARRKVVYELSFSRVGRTESRRKKREMLVERGRMPLVLPHYP